MKKNHRFMISSIVDEPGQHEGYASDMEHDAVTEGESSIALYVHIPFCRRRCRYCDFAIIPIGQRGLDLHDHATSSSRSSYDNGLENMMQNYSHSICHEIQYSMSTYYRDLLNTTTTAINNNTNHITKPPLNSIYFGGGTPSLAPIEMIERIFYQIKSMFRLLNNTEITIEIDPGTFTKEKLQGLRRLGFNRLSLGVQSFDDTILESLGRIHRTKDVYDSMKLIDEVYGDQVNLSIDLISGLPGLSLAKWTETLSRAVHLQPQPFHLSIYDLQIEKVCCDFQNLSSWFQISYV
jgi:coproporphyrinogen III oxidase-like Fe-S oxidoreductase